MDWDAWLDMRHDYEERHPDWWLEDTDDGEEECDV